MDWNRVLGSRKVWFLLQLELLGGGFLVWIVFWDWWYWVLLELGFLGWDKGSIFGDWRHWELHLLFWCGCVIVTIVF